jgi:type IV pilus assembly protein PilQ
MRQTLTNSHRIAALLALGIAAASWAAVAAGMGSPDLQSRKEGIVRNLLASQGRASEYAPLLESAKRAALLLDVRAVSTVDRARLSLHVDGPATPALRSSEDGRLWHVRLCNTIPVAESQTGPTSASGMLRKTGVRLIGAEPQFESELVVQLAAPALAEVTVVDNCVEVDFVAFAGGAPAARQVLRQELLRRGEWSAYRNAQFKELAARRIAMLGEQASAEAYEPARKLLAEKQERLCATLLKNARSLQKEVARALQEEDEAIRQAGKPYEVLAAEIAEARQADEENWQHLGESLTAWYEGYSEALLELPQDKASFETWRSAFLDDQEEGVGGSTFAEAPEFQTVDLEKLNFSWAQPSKRLAAIAPDQNAQSESLLKNADPLSNPVTSMLAGNPSGEAVQLAQAEMPDMEPEVMPASPAARSVPTGRVQMERPDPGTDPLYQRVTIDFREMELADVVALLAKRADVNVIAGPDVAVQGTVTAYLQDVPLITAMETVLRMNNLGMVEEEGIFRIVPYEEAIAAERVTRMIYLQKGQAQDVETTLMSVSAGMPQSDLISIAANESTNVIIISGPPDAVAELEAIAQELDVAEPTLATETEAIKLNYAEPGDVLPLVSSMLTPEGIGSVEGDERSRHIIVTDIPVVIDKVRSLVQQLDAPVKQVAIEAMVVDAVLRDSSQTGVNWLLDLVRERDRTGNVSGILSGRRNARNQVVGSVDDLNLGANLGNVGSADLDAGILTFGLLTDDFDFRGAIAAEAASSNAEILANPMVTTVENQEALIQIVQEFPYQEITQTTQGPPVSSTEFKEIGVELGVLPRVTHEDDIVVRVDAKQSSISGLTQDGIPIEDRRTAGTTLLTENGQTIFIGGLRDISDRTDISKVPVLGDVPIVNFMFRTTDMEEIHTELLIFLTCRVMGDSLPRLSPEHQVEHDKLQNTPDTPNTQGELFRSIVHPNEMRDPIWKWRRTP